MRIIEYKAANRQIIIKEALSVLKRGGLFVFPTETCYGIGANATDPKAIAKLFAYKTRREGKPLSIAVCDQKMASEYVFLNEIAKNLYKNYLPGPITVVSRGRNKVVPGIESEYGTLGIRIPDQELVLDICRTFKKPFTATSANISYLPKPYSVASLLRDTPQKSLDLIDLIIDAGALPHREASTVVDTSLNNLNVMRPGQIKLGQQVKGLKSILAAETKSAAETIKFGGMNMLKYIDEPLDKPLVFFLTGELGSGKTQFSKGLASKLGIKEIIKSPTFTILNEYDYKFGRRQGKFIHIDTWRLDSLKDLATIGFDQYLKANNIIAIEWADKFFADLKLKVKKAGGKIINVVFEYISEDVRSLKTYE